MSERAREDVVVGVDGSDASVGALEWAARYAGATGARLRVITAWAFPEHPTPFGVVPDVPPSGDQMAEVRAKLDRLVSKVVPRQTDVVAEVLPGAPAAVLLGAVKDADLLVVGSHSRTEIVDLLLGSVSERCLRRAPCPVVVVRPHR